MIAFHLHYKGLASDGLADKKDYDILVNAVQLIRDIGSCNSFVQSSKRQIIVARTAAVIIALAQWTVVNAAPAAEVVLVENGESSYQIVLADSASPATRHGAEELQMFLEEMTDVKLPIISDRQPQGPHELIVGDNAHLRNLGVEIEFADLGSEGYVIRSIDESLVIAGGEPRGNMYGVYGFLEDHLGCRWFAPGVRRIPKCTRLAIGPIEDRQVPVFEYREPYTLDCFDGDWCARNRMNTSRGNFEKKHGGKIAFGDDRDCHTFEHLVPPDLYFDEHPEYFALVDGERNREKQGICAQLCCTNPDVIRICTEKIRESMGTQPWATVFSVSQNDSYEPTPDNDRYEPGFCECSNCQALADQEDSQMAPVLHLVNRVAASVEQDFPDKFVQTLAYQWTRRPPKHMRPRPNVLIWLCSSGGCCCSHPLETCDSATSRAFRSDLEAWSKIAPRLWVWDYATNFAHYLMPFPNHQVCGANTRYFAKHNVKGVFIQDAGDTLDGELAALSGYSRAKVLWNPKYDENQAINEFLDGYYGVAAAPIREYIDKLYIRALSEDNHVTAFLTEWNRPHLTDEVLIEANELWQRAEALVTAEPDVCARVKSSRMSVDYAILERARLQAQQQLPTNEALRSLAAARFAPFMEVLLSSGLTCLSEATPLDKEAYRRQLASDLGIEQE